MAKANYCYVCSTMDFNPYQYGMFLIEWKDSNKISRELLYTSGDNGRVEKTKHKVPRPCWKREKFKTEPHVLKWLPFIVSYWKPDQLELCAYFRMSATMKFQILEHFSNYNIVGTVQKIRANTASIFRPSVAS